MNQKKICFISVLNPISHPRLFKEYIVALEIFDKVTVIGTAGKIFNISENIKFIVVRRFDRFSIRRVIIPISIFVKAFNEKADVYHIHTPEFLILGIILKLFLRSKIIYDVHEDYYLNIKFSKTYPFFFSDIFAILVRIKEHICVNFYDSIVIAENCYKYIFNSRGEKTFLVRNTYLPFMNKNHDISMLNNKYCIYSGNISENWGISESISLFEKIASSCTFSFVIVGSGMGKKYIQMIKRQINESPFSHRIYILGGENYIEPETISTLISNAEFGFALYKIQPHIKDRIPTKFYEYIYHKVPILFTNNSIWNQLNVEFCFGKALYDSDNSEEVLNWIKENYQNSYTKEIPNEIYSWDYDSKVLLNVWTKQIQD